MLTVLFINKSIKLGLWIILLQSSEDLDFILITIELIKFKIEKTICWASWSSISSMNWHSLTSFFKSKWSFVLKVQIISFKHWIPSICPLRMFPKLVLLFTVTVYQWYGLVDLIHRFNDSFFAALSWHLKRIIIAN
jgi:hypothetical protein